MKNKLNKIIKLALKETFNNNNCRQLALKTGFSNTVIWRYKNSMTKIPIDFILKLEEIGIINFYGVEYRLVNEK